MWTQDLESLRSEVVQCMYFLIFFFTFVCMVRVKKIVSGWTPYKGLDLPLLTSTNSYYRSYFNWKDCFISCRYIWRWKMFISFCCSWCLFKVGGSPWEPTEAISRWIVWEHNGACTTVAKTMPRSLEALWAYQKVLECAEVYGSPQWVECEEGMAKTPRGESDR